MTEHPQTGPTGPADNSDGTDHTGPAGPTEPGEPTELTGHPVVDEVLATMRGLQDRPVEEHVAIFEAAHDRLRAALTDAGDRAAPGGS